MAMLANAFLIDFLSSSLELPSSLSSVPSHLLLEGHLLLLFLPFLLVLLLLILLIVTIVGTICYNVIWALALYYYRIFLGDT
jgi:hypothetical protein